MEELKRVFNPGVRLWFVKWVTAAEDLDALRSILDEVLPSDFESFESESSQSLRGYCEHVLRQLLKEERGLAFIDVVEGMLQCSLSNEVLLPSPLVDAFSSSLKDGLKLTEEGFLSYKNLPARSFFQNNQPKSVVPEMDARKSQFQNIRKKRLRLLAQWESL